MDSLENIIVSVFSLDLNQTAEPPPKTKRQTSQQKQNKNKNKQETTVSFPQHHDKIAEQLPFVSWQELVSSNDYIHEHDSNIMGSFKCSNKKCRKKGWQSNVIAITIRMYADNKYNAAVYNQRCKSCSRLGNMSINIDSYVDRVVFRLKRWSGIPVEAPPFSDSSKGPHESSLCEGCKVGHCPRMKG